MFKILVVNNDFDLMTLLKTWLEKRDYQVHYTGNVDEVPQIMTTFQPDIVMVDILQSKVAALLKANAETASVPILLMTGYANSKDYPSDNSDDVIRKPFDLEILEAKIKSLLRPLLVPSNPDALR